MLRGLMIALFVFLALLVLLGIGLRLWQAFT